MKAPEQYQTLSDEELFELLREQNDVQAFATLYERYAQQVYTYCLKMLGNKMEAEDLYQDIFLRMYDYRNSFHGGHFAGWLFTIARTQCLNRIRQRKNTVDESILNEMRFAVPPSWEDTLLLREQIDQALQKLPEPFREVIILRFYQELSFAEIAEQLGISLSLAKVRNFRALKMLRQLLAPILKEYRYDES